MTDAVTLRIDAAMRTAGSRQPAQQAGGDQPGPTEAATQDLRRAIVAMEHAQQATKTVVAWSALTRMAMISVPYLVALVALIALAVPVAEIVGVGPLSRWAWDSFEAADSWGTKTWIALATLSVVSAVVYGVYQVGNALVERYKAYK